MVVVVLNLDSGAESEAISGSSSKRHHGTGEHFKASWKLPPGITLSTMGVNVPILQAVFEAFSYFSWWI